MTPHEAEEVLCKLVRPTPSFRHALDGPAELHDYAQRPFIGRVEARRFKFHRVITGRNSFMPIISGEIVDAEGGAELRGVMRLHVGVAIFMVIWLSVLIDLRRLSGALAESNVTDVIIPLGLAVLFVAIAIAVFVAERRKAMRLLSDAFGTRHAGQHP